MTIAIRNRSYPLPATLMNCPHCQTGELVWDTRWAWRCDGKKCRHGVALSAIFDDLDLEIKFSTAQVDLSKLPLAEYGHKLVMLGVLHLSWMTVTRVHREAKRLQILREEEDEGLSMRVLMRRPELRGGTE
jgi:hypothetical protein